MAVNDVYKVRVYTKIATQNAFNVGYWQTLTETGSGATLAQLVAFFDARFAAPYKAYMADSAEYMGVGVQKISPAPIQAEGFTTANRGFGGVEEEMLPPAVAYVITMRTQFAGRKFRGRKYLPFWPETRSTSGTPDNTAATQAGTLAGLWFAQALSVGTVPNQSSLAGVLYHRSTDTTNIILNATPRLEWGTQRRRSRINRADQPAFS